MSIWPHFRFPSASAMAADKVHDIRLRCAAGSSRHVRLNSSSGIYEMGNSTHLHLHHCIFTADTFGSGKHNQTCNRRYLGFTLKRSAVALQSIQSSEIDG